MPRRTAFLLTALAWTAVPGPAVAHTPAKVQIDAPAEGAVLATPVVPVVIRAVGGTSPAEFRLFVDGTPVDTTGNLNPESLFLDFRVASGESRRVTFSAPAGAHELRIRYKLDQGHEPPDVVRRFSVAASPTPSFSASGVLVRDVEEEGSSGFSPLVLWAIGGSVVVALLAAGAARAKQAASRRS